MSIKNQRQIFRYLVTINECISEIEAAAEAADKVWPGRRINRIHDRLTSAVEKIRHVPVEVGTHAWKAQRLALRNYFRAMHCNEDDQLTSSDPVLWLEWLTLSLPLAGDPPRARRLRAQVSRPAQ